MQDLNYLLLLIEEWIEVLSDDEIREAVRSSGNSFYEFLKMRGVDPRITSKIIMTATGYHPKNIWKVAECEFLKQVLFSYEAVPTTIAHEEKLKGYQYPADEAIKRTRELF